MNKVRVKGALLTVTHLQAFSIDFRTGENTPQFIPHFTIFGGEHAHGRTGYFVQRHRLGIGTNGL
jgi:hypothetical protein